MLLFIVEVANNFNISQLFSISNSAYQFAGTASCQYQSVANVWLVEYQLPYHPHHTSKHHHPGVKIKQLASKVTRTEIVREMIIFYITIKTSVI